MKSTVDLIFDYTIPEVSDVAVFFEKKPEKVTKKRIVKHIVGELRKLAVRILTRGGLSQ